MMDRILWLILPTCLLLATVFFTAVTLLSIFGR